MHTPHALNEDNARPTRNDGCFSSPLGGLLFLALVGLVATVFRVGIIPAVLIALFGFLVVVLLGMNLSKPLRLSVQTGQQVRVIQYYTTTGWNWWFRIPHPQARQLTSFVGVVGAIDPNGAFELILPHGNVIKLSNHDPSLEVHVVGYPDSYR